MNLRIKTLYVIKIQSVYKGYYIRQKLRIFYKLPMDIQRKIIWHMNNNIYVKNFNSSITKLIVKKIYNFVHNNWNNLAFNKYYYNKQENLNLHLNIVSNIYYLLRIICKYNVVIKYDYNLQKYLCRINKFISTNMININNFNLDNSNNYLLIKYTKIIYNNYYRDLKYPIFTISNIYSYWDIPILH